ncbi:MAG: DUF4174 domain-containing protein [Albidovulum sp.]
MKPILAALALSLLAFGAGAAEEPGFAPESAADVTLSDFRWQKRPVVVFADTPADPAFTEQMRLLEKRWPELAERDVVVITDTDPSAASDARTRLRPRGFMFVLMDKDGTVAQRKPFPWDVREISRAIDKMPIRREELRVRRLGD